LNEQRDYGKLAEEVKRSINARFLGEDEYAALRVGPADRSPSQTSNLLPLALDMVPAEKKEKVLGTLLDSVARDWDYHPDTGIIGTRYLLEVLTDNGRADAAYRIVAQKSYPGWGYMVAEGATTLWERWEKLTGGGMNSHNHIMLGSVDAWFYRSVAGLRSTAPGWRKMSIRPELFGHLDRATARIMTVRGLAEVSWRKEGEDFFLAAKIPLGSEAEIYIPGPAVETEVWEAGQLIWPLSEEGETPPEIKALRRDGPWIVFSTGSGSYEFRSRKSDKA
jgi:alpha-L-rhamnosidase